MCYDFGMYTHPIDRLVYRARPVILLLFWVSGPVALYTYGRLAVLAVEQWPWWASLGMVISHLFALVAIGCLFDRQEERRMSQEDDPSEPLHHS